LLFLPIMIRLAILPALAGCLLLAACGDDPGGAGGDGARRRVVATTTQVADNAPAVAGGRAEVVGLLPPNADPHAYELRPDDVERIADADLIVRSGGDLDDWLDDALEAGGSDAETLVLIEQVATISGGHAHDDEQEHAEETAHDGEDEHADEEIDPHWWHDPRNGVLAAEAIRDALAKADPGGQRTYVDATERYIARIRALDRAAAACFAAVPADRRKLVTTHDALGYLAERYDLEVIGAVIPSRSTQGQASARETSELIETMKREQVRAVFTETSVNVDVEQAIADEAGARLGDPLYADTLGPANSDGGTYLGALAANTEAIVAGLTEGRGDCELPR
jgi:ABC-type Zn uptake system ZnuABC Zn-binding protein ZnuA